VHIVRTPSIIIRLQKIDILNNDDNNKKKDSFLYYLLEVKES